MAGYWVFALAAIIVLALILTPVFRLRRSHALAARPFPDSWDQLLQRRWALYRHLPSDVRLSLQRQLQVMISGTDFYECNGLSLSEEMRVLILAQASLMNAGPGRMQWGGFPLVLVYPDAFVREGEVTDELGLVSYERDALLGESWEQGKVVLSWADVARNLRLDDGHSLVVHEYAHQIDGADGVMDGTPPMANSEGRKRWTQVMQQAFEDFQRRLDHGLEVTIDPYGAMNREEFFAVISEHFFTRPDKLANVYPDLYRELAQFYRLQPLAWRRSGSS